MDLYLYMLHLLLLSVSLFLFVRYLYAHKSKGICGLPPGGKGWPWEFYMAGRLGNPGKFIKHRMTKYSPDVFQASWFGENVVMLCGISGNKFVFSGENKYVRTWLPPSFSRAYQFPRAGDHAVHQFRFHVRSFMLEFLKGESWKNYIPIMDTMAKQHLDTYWSPNKQVKVSPLSIKYTFALACRLFMGVKDPNYVNRAVDQYEHVVEGYMSVPINLPGTAYYRAMKGGRILIKEFLEIMKQRKMEVLKTKETGATDILTRLLIASTEKGLDIKETEIAVAMLALFTAVPSLSTLITFVIHYLALHPHVYQKVLQEQMEIASSKGPGELLDWNDVQKMKYTWCVACETLRIAPPPGQFREAITDFTYAGFTIPKGFKVFWSPHTTHKNPEYFPDPEKFDPSRFEGNGTVPYAFVPFGGGTRMCLGKENARLTILTFLHNAVIKFKWEKVTPTEKIKYCNSKPFLANGLPIRLQPHKS